MSLEAFVILFYRRNFHHFLAVSFITVRRLISKTFSTSSDNPLTSLQGLLAHHHHHHRLQHQLLLLPRRDTGTELKWWPSSIFIGWYFFTRIGFKRFIQNFVEKKFVKRVVFRFFQFRLFKVGFLKRSDFIKRWKRICLKTKIRFQGWIFRLNYFSPSHFSFSWFSL